MPAGYGPPQTQSWYPTVIPNYGDTMLPAQPYTPSGSGAYGQTSSPTFVPTTGVPGQTSSPTYVPTTGAPQPIPTAPPPIVRRHGQTQSPSPGFRPFNPFVNIPNPVATGIAATANIWNALTQPGYRPPGTPPPPAPPAPPNATTPTNPANPGGRGPYGPNGPYNPVTGSTQQAARDQAARTASWVSGNANRVSYAPLYPGGPLVPITPRPTQSAVNALPSQQRAAERDYQTSIASANIAVATPTKQLTVDSRGNIIRAPSWTGLEVLDMFSKDKFPSVVFANDFQMADYQTEGQLSGLLDQYGYRQISPGVFARVNPQPVWNNVTKSWDTVRPPGSYWAGRAAPTGVGYGIVPPEGDPMWNDYSSIYVGTMRPEDEKKAKGGGYGGGYGYGGGRGGGGGGRGGRGGDDSYGYNPYVDYARTLESGAVTDNSYFGGGRTSNGRYYNPQFLGAINWRGI